MSEVLYCYRCGKHVKRGGGKCWYCNTPTRRTVRPARRCSFCDEEIRPGAIKCPHCKEFLDGRPGPEASGPAQPIVYMIDKAIIQGDQPLQLPGGEPVPSHVANLLSKGTLKAIRANDPALIDQPGVRALPAPEGPTPEGDAAPQEAEILDVSAVRGGPAEGEDVGSDTALVRTPDGTFVPVDDAPPESGHWAARDAGRALARVAGGVMEAWRHRPGRTVVDNTVEKESRYRDCPSCDTEVLGADNFCFHCGLRLREDAGVRAPNPADAYPSNVGVFFFAIVLMVVFVGLARVGAGAQNPWVLWAPAGVSGLLIVLSFFRRRTSLSQLTSLVLMVAWIVCVGWVLLLFA